MAYILAISSGGPRTWTVLDAAYGTVLPVEDWLEAHRHLWSPNTVRAYATALAQWWTFLEQRNEADRWRDVGVPAVTGFLSWLRNGRTVEHSIEATEPEPSPSGPTLEARLAALISFYRWQEAVFEVPVARRLLREAPRRHPARGLLAHLDGRSAAAPSSLVRVRRHRSHDRPPLLLPQQIQAVLDACAVYDAAAGVWVGNLRDRLLFATLAEKGMRLGELLGMRISDFVMGRGDMPYIAVVPREDNTNGARVKMMRPRRVYVGTDLERLFADYITHLACRAAEFGIAVTADCPLWVNLDRPPLLAALRESTVRDKTEALRRKGVGPQGWTPHWFRHSHATALLLAGTPEWVVARRLGHAHVQTTLDLYGWVREDEALRAAANWASYTSGWRVTDAGERRLRAVDAADPIWRLWEQLPPEWRGPVIGPGISNWQEISPKDGGRQLGLTGLPDVIAAEMAWMAHWQVQDGTQPSVLALNHLANILRWAIRERHPFPPSIRAMDWPTVSALRGWFYATRWRRLPTTDMRARLRIIFGPARTALLARCHDGPWWELDEWHPRCDPRIPLSSREPLATVGGSPGQLTVPWLRAAAKWHLGTMLESGTLRWSTASHVRLPCLRRFDRWLTTCLDDPRQALGDPAAARQQAAAYARWAADRRNRTSRECDHRHLGKPVDARLINDELRAVAELFAFIASNAAEARTVLGIGPWQQVTDAHAASWFRQVSRIPHKPGLNDEHYVDDHALAQITAALPLLGLPRDEQMLITRGDGQRRSAWPGWMTRKPCG